MLRIEQRHRQRLVAIGLPRGVQVQGHPRRAPLGDCIGGGAEPHIPGRLVRVLHQRHRRRRRAAEQHAGGQPAKAQQHALAVVVHRIVGRRDGERLGRLPGGKGHAPRPTPV